MYNKYFLIAFTMLLNSFVAYGQPMETNQQNDTTIVQKTIILNEVIITGNIKKDPSQVIIKEDFMTKVVQPKNSGELFSDINGFSLIKRGGYAVDPIFRASLNEQLNIQFDGGTKPTHACPNRMDPITTFINSEEITRIEIIKGPFSVRYGNTFGGIINMISNTANTSQKLISGSFSSGHESNGNASVYILNLKSNIKKLDLSGNLSYRNFGNYEDGNGSEIPSSFKNTGYSLKVGYNFTENQRLQVNLKQNFGRDILHAGLPMDTEYDNSTIGSIDYKLFSNGNVFKGLTTHLYYSFVDHLMSNKRRKGFDISEASAPVNATSYGGKIEAELDFNPKIKIFTGIDLNNISREGVRNRLVKKNMIGVILANPLSFVDKIWQNSYTNTLGVFAEGKWFISEKSMFNLGIRLDNVVSDARDLASNFAALYPNLRQRTEHNISGTISYKYNIKPNYSLEISFGRGSRAANIEERYIANLNIGRDSYEYIGNPNLKAEVNNQFEIGFNAKENFQDFINSIKYGGTFYYSIYEDYIIGIEDPSLIRTFMPTTAPIHPKIFRNITDAMKTGFEVYGDINFAENLSFVTEIAYVYTENKDFKESLPLTPPLITRLKLGYEKKLFWTSINYSITGSQNRISNSFGESATASYEILDLKAGINLLKNLNIGVGVLNLFDKYYNNHLNFSFNSQDGFGKTPIREPGRNITIFANYKFY